MYCHTLLLGFATFLPYKVEILNYCCTMSTILYIINIFLLGKLLQIYELNLQVKYMKVSQGYVDLLITTIIQNNYNLWYPLLDSTFFWTSLHFQLIPEKPPHCYIPTSHLSFISLLKLYQFKKFKNVDRKPVFPLAFVTYLLLLRQCK